MSKGKCCKEGLSYYIADAVKHFRKKKEMSLTDLSKKCQIARSSLSRIENHHVVPSLETLSVISFGLGVPLIEIVQWANEHSNNDRHKDGWSPTVEDLERLGGDFNDD